MFVVIFGIEFVYKISVNFGVFSCFDDIYGIDVLRILNDVF